MKKSPWSALAAACAALLLALPAAAACPSDLEAARLVAAYMQRQPIANPPALSVADAQCGRDKIAAFLAQQLGPIAGYKAGLTSAAVQKRFHHDQPVRGTLFRQMLVADGAEVPARFGARPLFEADLLVRVSRPGIHHAKTPAEVLHYIDAVIPFIELPDLLVEEPARLDGAGITYLNAGARMGVMGKPLATSSSLGRQLAEMQVRVLDGQGRELDHGQGRDVLGHPLQAVIWLARDLARAGVHLHPGDLVSLGSFSKLALPEADMDIRVIYEGLAGTPAVGVKFR